MPEARRPNIDWISNLRLIALYAVIVLHCSSPPLAAYGKILLSDWWQADFFNAITRFAVPVFVMITGALLLNREYELGDFLKKRLMRVVIPFLFWSLVYIWYSWYNEEITLNGDILNDMKIVLHLLKTGSSYHLWYVYMLIGLYFFIPVIGKFVRNASEKEVRYFLVVWFAVLLISQPYLAHIDPSVDMHYFAGFAGYLVLGHWLAYADFKIKNLRLWMLLLAIVCILIIAFGSKLLLDHPIYPGTTLYEPVNPVVVLLASSLFLLAKYTSFKMSPKMTAVRDFVGKYNYGIYLAHALALYFLDDPLGISYQLTVPIISIPLAALCAFIIAFTVVWLISLIPYVGKRISG